MNDIKATIYLAETVKELWFSDPWLVSLAMLTVIVNGLAAGHSLTVSARVKPPNIPPPPVTLPPRDIYDDC